MKKTITVSSGLQSVEMDRVRFLSMLNKSGVSQIVADKFVSQDFVDLNTILKAQEQELRRILS